MKQVARITRLLGAVIGFLLAVTASGPKTAGPRAGGFLVVQVIDGDTILLENGESVRYIGIDAPETHHPTRGIECYGEEAFRRNRELVEGMRVRLESDVTDRDRYGRLLRYVYVGNVMVNAVLVEEGYAFSYYYPPDVRYYPTLVRLEVEAEESGRGMWSTCQR